MVPHAPQFLASEVSRVQWSVQNVCPVGHAPHTPAAHPWPLGHMVPHAPQFLASEVSMVQWSVQYVCPAGHMLPMHMPLLHICPVGHAWPHAPQLSCSFSETQTPPQRLRAGGQVIPASVGAMQ